MSSGSAHPVSFSRVTPLAIWLQELVDKAGQQVDTRSPKAETPAGQGRPEAGEPAAEVLLKQSS